MGKGRASSKEAARRGAGKPSAFESAQINSKKHVVLGQRERGRAKSTLQARTRANDIRRETLLVEHQQEGRTNVFADGRFGEGDESLPHEDKLIARFQRERQRQARSSKFALTEEEGTADGWELTHGGRALGEMEDGELADEADFGVDDDDNGAAERLAGGFGSSDFIKAVHFGGGEGAEKTAKEALDEAIARHKLARLDRKELKMQERSLVDQLDADFDETRRLIFASSDAARPPKGAAAKGAPPAAEPAQQQFDYRGGKAQPTGAYGDYEKTMKQLGGEMRAQPSDRLLSEGERAAAERQRLRNLEEDRLHRMKAGADRQNGGRGPTDDDLAENFVMEAAPRLELKDGKLQLQGGEGARAAGEEGEEEGEEEEGEEEEGEEEEGEEEEEEEGEEMGAEGEEVEEKEGEEEEEVEFEPVEAAVEEDSAVPADLPYVFACPADKKELDELLGLAKGSIAGQRALLHRLLANHHTKLAEANQQKLAAVARLLLQRLQRLARLATRAALAQTAPLVAALYAISQQIRTPVAELLLKALAEARGRWKRAVRPNSYASLPPDTLATLALAAQLYPASDFRHAVLTPCLLFLGEVLAQTSVPQSGTGLRRCIFCCDLALEYLSPAKRFMPELHGTVVSLLRALLASPTDPPTPEGGRSQGSVPWSLQRAAAANAGGSSGRKQGGTKQKGGAAQPDPPLPQPLQFSMLAAEAGGAEGSGGGFVDEAAAIFRLVQQLAALHSELPSFPELFRPPLEMLQQSPGEITPPDGALAAAHAACLAQLLAGVQRAEALRLPLRLHRKAPVPIKQFNPAFEVDFQPDRSLDPDRERAAMQRLQRKVKKEKKGAVRELRKDAAFLAVERRKQQKATSDYLEGRGKRAMQIMEEQEASWKSMKKEKRNSAKLL